VLDFLARCGKTDAMGKAELLNTFHRYLIASCWIKMRIRITHGYSKATLGILTTLTPHKMQHIYKTNASRMTPSLRRDSALAEILIGLDDEGVLQSIVDENLEEYRASIVLNSTSIKSLVDGLRTLSSAPRPGASAYCEQTSFPFHLLLVAVINGFGEGLMLLKEKVDREANARQVLQFGHLLWRIAYSQMLARHLELLGAGNFLRPAATEEEQPATGDDEDRDEGVDVAQELEEGDDGSAKTFRRWIQLLISHWSAADILSRFTTNPATEGAGITLIDVRSSHPRTSMEAWDGTIRRLAYCPPDGPTDDFNAETAITLFTQKIEDPNFDAKSVLAFRVKDKCKALHPGQVVFNGSIHCEAAMGMLMKFIPATTEPLLAGRMCVRTLIPMNIY
jgi:hypothetical protein